MSRQRKYSEQEILNDIYDEDGGSIRTGNSGGSVVIGGEVIPVERVFADVAASQTNSTIRAAVTGKKIRVLSLVLLAGATATTIQFTSNNTNAISPNFANGANGGMVLPKNNDGWFETASGEALKVTTGAGSATSILINYVKI